MSSLFEKIFVEEYDMQLSEYRFPKWNNISLGIGSYRIVSIMPINQLTRIDGY